MTFQDMVMQASEGVLNHAAMEELPEDRGEKSAEIARRFPKDALDSMSPKTDGSNRESIAQLWIKED